MRDARGDVVYVGKAQSLRNRVRSYWQKQAPRRARATGSGASSTASSTSRYTITDSVCEALLLEANLIKRYRPRFNVRLKDDKSYPYIKVTLADDFPRIERTRKLVKDGSRYFGPYASASSVDESMNLVRRLFPFRTCTIDIKDGERALQRPCLLYHIKRCQGPCIRPSRRPTTGPTSTRSSCSSRAARRPSSRRSRGEMARGRRADRLRAGGGPARQGPGHRADDGEPEDGGLRPDRARPGRPRPAGQPGGDPAVRHPRRQGDRPRRVPARRGARGEPTTRSSPASSSSTTRAPARSRARSTSRPPIAERPSSRRSSPSGAAGRSTCACRSAARSASCWRSPRATPARRSPASRRAGWPTRARRWPRSRSWPRRSGCRGRRCASSATTSATSRAPNRSAAWSSSRTASRGPGSTAGSGSGRSQGPNDFASHQEVLRRRFRSRGRARRGVEEELRWAMPDLVIIDGGKGQVSAAKEVLDELGPPRPAAGRPRQGARGAVPARTAPSRSSCRATSPALYLVQRLRDEAHRFAITYHRDLREPADGPVRVRRPAGRRPEAQARAAQGVRLGQARARGAGRADRRGARDRPGARRDGSRRRSRPDGAGCPSSPAAR